MGSAAAQALFEAGGREILPPSIQKAVRDVVEGEASRVLAGVRLLEGGVARVATAQTAGAAARQILRSVGVAAGAGVVVDGGWAIVQVLRRARRGPVSRGEALAYVAREAATGAAATAAGTAAGVLLVALTGGVAAPAVFLVGAATSVGAKAGLSSWLAARGRRAIAVEAALTPAV